MEEAGRGVMEAAVIGMPDATSAWMADQLGRPSPSRVVRALRG